MFFPNRRLALGYLALLLPPLIVTLLAFVTLARVDESQIVVGVPLDATPIPTVDPLEQTQDYFETGLAQQAQGNYAAAEAAYRAALAIEPALAPVHGALGSLYVAMERPSEALLAYQSAADLEPQAAEWQRALGIVQANLGNLNAAVAALEAAVTLAPQDARLHFELGQVYAYLQRTEQARQAFNQALLLNPDATLAAALNEQLRLLAPPP